LRSGGNFSVGVCLGLDRSKLNASPRLRFCHFLPLTISAVALLHFGSQLGPWHARGGRSLYQGVQKVRIGPHFARDRSAFKVQARWRFRHPPEKRAKITIPLGCALLRIRCRCYFEQYAADFERINHWHYLTVSPYVVGESPLSSAAVACMSISNRDSRHLYHESGTRGPRRRLR
jgi:hypothetical protein